MGKPKPKKMKNQKEITEFCEKHNITQAQFRGEEGINSSLYLSGLTSIPDGFNPTVGGCLDLNGLTSIPTGFHPIVGGNLWLAGINSPTTRHPTVMSWQGGKYVSIDGIFAEVVSKKGNSYKLRKIGQDKPFYAIVDGALAAHGATLRDARTDLAFKKLQKTMNVDELVAAIKQRGTVTADEYRLLTGACREGVMQFKAQHNIRGKSLPLAKVLKLTEGEYGGSRMAELFN